MRTDELLESPRTDDPASVHGEKDDTDARWAKFDFGIQGFKGRTCSVIVLLAMLAVFVRGHVVITAITRTVSAKRWRSWRCYPTFPTKKSPIPWRPKI